MPPLDPKSQAQTDTNSDDRGRRANWAGVVLAITLFVACGVGIYVLSADARREIDALATANVDSTQWALAQSEVELLAVLSEARRDDLDVAEQAVSVRRRFNVFYSRISTLQNSSVLMELRDANGTGVALNQMADLLDRYVPAIDGPDEGLIAALQTLTAELEEIRPVVRGVSLSGVTYFAQAADDQRIRVMEALVRLGFLTFLLVAALSTLLLALVRSYRKTAHDGLEMAEARKRMSVIVSTSLDAIVVVNVQGQVIEYNEAAEEIFGYSREEILYQKMSGKIVPDKYFQAHEDGMAGYIKTGEQHVVGQGRVQLEAKHKTGRVFPVEMSISAAEGPDGEIFVSYLRDISEQLAKQEELIKARDEALAGEHAKANLVAVMSHEMRTPLNGIVGALELLKTTDLDKTQAQMTDVMGTSTAMLLQHVNDVLDMSKLEAGAIETIKRPFDPVRVTKEILDSLRMSAKDHANVLELRDVDPEFNRVLGDPGKLRQILTNLVGNAIKFTRHGKITVEIETQPSQDTWELRVRDDGIGISQEDQKAIFDDFVTLDPSYTRAQEGTGLGLSIVRRLVEHMGGQIGVESHEGEGAMFWVRLPTNISGQVSTQDTPTQMDAETGQTLATPSLSVLLVEDNAINRFIAGEMLTRLGHTFTEAHDGHEAVAAARKLKFDAILMDISMPGMDGVEATKQILAQAGVNAETPIFATTAHAMPADITRFTNAGMKDVLIKPISVARLQVLLSGGRILSDAERSGPEHWDRTVQSDLRSTLGQETADNLMAMFTKEMDLACSGFFDSPDLNDIAGLKAEVHKMAGSASILGAMQLRSLLSEIEDRLSTSQLEGIESLLTSVSPCWDATKTEIVLLT